MTSADKDRHVGRRKAGFNKPESRTPNPSVLQRPLDVQRKRLRRVSLSQADMPGEPIRNPDKINGTGGIADPLAVPFLMPDIIEAVDHPIGRSSHRDGCPGMLSSKSSCEGVGSQLRPMVLPQQIARRSDPVPHSSPLVHSVAGARPSGPALHSRSHGATPTGTRRRDRHIHMPVIQDRQRRRPAPHAAACASAS